MINRESAAFLWGYFYPKNVLVMLTTSNTSESSIPLSVGMYPIAVQGGGLPSVTQSEGIFTGYPSDQTNNDSDDGSGSDSSDNDGDGNNSNNDSDDDRSQADNEDSGGNVRNGNLPDNESGVKEPTYPTLIAIPRQLQPRRSVPLASQNESGAVPPSRAQSPNQSTTNSRHQCIATVNKRRLSCSAPGPMPC